MIFGFTCGSFDLLHAGHIAMLEEAKSKCDYLKVGLQTDPTIDRSHKNSPVQSMYERWKQLKAVKFVDEIIPYDTEEDLLNLLHIETIDIRFVGGDYIDKTFTGMCDFPDRILCLTKRKHSFSTTELRNRVVNASR